jgi:hypothetical protein
MHLTPTVMSKFGKAALLAYNVGEKCSLSKGMILLGVDVVMEDPLH